MPRQAFREREPVSEPAGTRPFDPEIVRELATLLADTDLTEIEVEKGDLRIRVARTPASTTVVQAAPVVQSGPVMQAGPVMQTGPAAGAAGLASVSAESGAPAQHPNAVTSPMVGTAYRRPSPGTPTFVEVGSTVRAGDKLLLIEAMKTFNDILAPRGGTVRAIYVDDGQPVEYGEPLIVID